MIKILLRKFSRITFHILQRLEGNYFICLEWVKKQTGIPCQSSTLNLHDYDILENPNRDTLNLCHFEKLI